MNGPGTGSPDSQLVLARGEVEGPVHKIQWEG
jgi:hypothetical protein